MGRAARWLFILGTVAASASAVDDAPRQQLGIPPDRPEEAAMSLADRLHHEDRQVRLRALRSLQSRRTADAAAVTLLKAVLRDDTDAQVRFGAAGALEVMGRAGAPVEAALLEALEDPVPFVRGAALTALVDLRAKSVLPILARLIEGGQEDYACFACHHLDRFGPQAKALVPALVAALRRPTAGTQSLAPSPGPGPSKDAPPRERREDVATCLRRQAARILGRVGGPEMAPALVEALSDEDEQVRTGATSSLYLLGGQPEAFAPLAAALEHPNPRVRRGAAQAIGAADAALVDQVVPVLLRLAADDDVDVREAAIRALDGGRARKDAAATLLAALHDASPKVRAAALEALAHSPSLAPVDVAATAIGLLEDTDPGLRTRAAVSLARATHVPGVTPALRRALGDPDRRVRETAAGVLGQTGLAGSASVATFMEGLRNDDAGARAHAASALGKLREPTAVPALARVLEDPDRRVRLVAASALGETGSEAAVPSLIAALARCESEDDGLELTRALQKIGKGSEEALLAFLGDGKKEPWRRRVAALALDGRKHAAIVVPLLTGALESNYRIALQALFALHSIGPPAAPAVPALTQLLQREEKDLAGHAVRVLAAIGSAALPAAPALEKLLDHRDLALRVAAAEALSRIRSDPTVGLSALLSALEGCPAATAYLALDALSHRRGVPERAIPAVVRCFAAPQWEVRQRAAQTLGCLGSEDAIPALRQALEDPHSGVRGTAKTALWRLERRAPCPSLR